MSTLSLVQTFARNFKSQIPDTDKDNVTRTYEFKGKFKLFQNTPEMKSELDRVQREEGLSGFLNRVMVSCEPVSSDLQFTDENGTEVDCMTWVKNHVICQQDATMAFWEVVNKGAEEKNLKKSRAR